MTYGEAVAAHEAAHAAAMRESQRTRPQVLTSRQSVKVGAT